MVTAVRPGSEEGGVSVSEPVQQGLEGSERLSAAEAPPEVLCWMRGLPSKSAAGAEQSKALPEADCTHDGVLLGSWAPT